MPRFLVSFTRTTDCDIEVDAKDANEAERLVDDGTYGLLAAYEICESISVSSVEEIEE